MRLETRFAEAMTTLCGPDLSGPFGIAVSGGGDSLALMALAAEWAAPKGIALKAVTVDHGLRAEAAEEAAGVARQADALGLSHDILTWDHSKTGGNLQDAARRARLTLIGDWAQRHGVQAVLLGHTEDDVAETLLLRLARGAGVDGLAAMAARRRAAGMIWLRPLLGVSRAALREALRARGLDWAEDASNDDPRFDRVKARAALEALAPLGIDRAGLAATATRLAASRAALEVTTQDAARGIARVGPAGEVVIEAAGLAALMPDIRRRLLVGTLRWVAGADYAPRHEALVQLMTQIAAGKGGTLHGCRIAVAAGRVTICRELKAVAGMQVPAPGPWDTRWRITGPKKRGLSVAALGADGLNACPAWRETGASRAAVMATPALWRDGQLVAAPLAGRADGWHAELIGGQEGYFLALLTH